MKTKITVLTLFVILFGSCKPVKIVTEKERIVIDSTSIMTLKEVLHYQMQENDKLRLQYAQEREENMRLTSEIESHVINYDTAGKVDSTTGKYPIASETTTSSKNVMEKQIKEYKNMIQEYEREIKTMEQKNSNLQYEVKSLRDENIELKSKTAPSFNFKSFIYGIAGGFILLIVILGLWKMK